MQRDSATNDFAPSASLETLRQRSELLKRLREFFYKHGFIEVETPLLSDEVIPELHIEPIETQSREFLQASPELHMKRLVAAGAQAIFQVTRSFRSGEHGRLHNPEFTIVEWYRVGDDLQAGMNLLDELVQTLLGTPTAPRTTYAEAFQRIVGICPHTSTTDQLAAAANAAAIATPAGMNRADLDEWLNLLLATIIEPQLGRGHPEIVYHYPASQASLAKIAPSPHGYDVAERFELYYRGIELANGFHELTDAAELRCRFDSVNAVRAATGRRGLAVPNRLLTALEHGLPDCTGCALGFDRLAMLALGLTSLNEATAFSS